MCFICVVVVAVLAVPTHRPTTLHLRTRVIDTRTGAESFRVADGTLVSTLGPIRRRTVSSEYGHPHALLPAHHGVIGTYLLHVRDGHMVDVLCSYLAGALTFYGKSVSPEALCAAYVPYGGVVLTLNDAVVRKFVRTHRAVVDWSGLLMAEDKMPPYACFVGDNEPLMEVVVTLTPPHGLAGAMADRLAAAWGKVLTADAAWASGARTITLKRKAGLDVGLLRRVVAASPYSLSLAHAPHAHTLIQWADEVVQSYTYSGGGASSSMAALHAVGLDGTGQVVGITDTGVDQRSPFFAGRIASYMTMSYNLGQGTKQTDTRDHINGHGTHVAGAAVGDASHLGGAASAWRGAAPKARLAVVDMQSTSDPALSDDSLVLPPDLNTGLWNRLYGVGARVMSGSWGAGGSGEAYSNMAWETDGFLWQKRAAIITLAAGNSGSYGAQTMSDPALAKNVIAVGMTLNERSSAQYHYRRTELTVSFGGSGSYTAYVQTRYSAVYVPGTTAWNGAVVVLSSGSTGCSASGLAGAGAGASRPVVVSPWNSVCTMSERVAAAAAVPGVTTLLVYDLTGVPPTSVGSVKDLESEAAASSTGLFDSLLFAGVSGDLGGLGGSVTATFTARGATATLPRSMQSRFSPESLSLFSSLGPTGDGRIKPDIVMPGEYVWSARAGTTTGARPSNIDLLMIPMRGTSMATPVAAGAAALVRQYFTDGYYAGGGTPAARSITAAGQVPSGALLKAILIHCASPLSSDGQRMSTQTGSGASQADGVGPNTHWGWGRPELTNVLYVTGLSLPFGLYVDDSRGFNLRSGVSQPYVTYSLVHPGGGASLRATLVWTDYPCCDVGNPDTLLVSDLDLEVRKATGGTIYTAGDHVNTVERVEVPPSALGGGTTTWHITVRGTTLENPGNTDYQPYSLVVTVGSRAGWPAIGVSAGAGYAQPAGGNSKESTDPIGTPDWSGGPGSGAISAVSPNVAQILACGLLGMLLFRW